MPLPIPSHQGPLKAQLRYLRDEVRKLHPMRSHGILTSRGTRGVRRRPLRLSGQGDNSTGAARWA